MSIRSVLTIATLAACSSASYGAISLTALSTFGGGDGWLAPGEGGYAFLGTANNERGMAYGNGHLYLVSRSGGNNVRILNGSTGADLGGLDVTGIAGGTFPINVAATGSDGAIYVSNLAGAISPTAPYKVYKWSTEAAAPVVAVSDGTSLPGARLGDSLAATGGGSSTRLAAGYAASPAVTGNNSYALLDPTADTSTPVAFTGSPPLAGDFRLGITFTDSSHVIGAQGSSLYRYTSFSGTAGTLIASPLIPDPAGATADRLLSYAVINGLPLLAVQSIGDSHVSLYDVTDPAAPIHLASANNTSGTLTANANGTGQLAWAYSGGDTATLYAMSTNQGIQAFTVVVPEPASLSAIASLALLGARRRK